MHGPLISKENLILTDDQIVALFWYSTSFFCSSFHNPVGIFLFCGRISCGKLLTHDLLAVLQSPSH